MNKLAEFIKKYQGQFASVLPPQLQHGKAYIFDLSSENNEFKHLDANDTDALIAHTQDLLRKNDAVIGLGRYAEERKIYSTREYFQAAGERNIHLGIDLSVPPSTPISSPLGAIVHSFKNNVQSGNYGPTIILQHQLADRIFYTLYGHLSEESLENLSIHQKLEPGAPFATVGHHSINGKWPPHLHFQIIDDIQDYRGDFPGVIDIFQKDIYLQRCPDPNLILQIKALGN